MLCCYNYAKLSKSLDFSHTEQRAYLIIIMFECGYCTYNLLCVLIYINGLNCIECAHANNNTIVLNKKFEHDS